MKKILAVDDSNSVRQMVQFILNAAGYHVTEASDGMEALNIAKSEQFDMVLTDVNMPLMDGIGLVRALRQLPDYNHVPIVLLTTESGNYIQKSGKFAGATGRIVKPISKERLLDAVEKVLG